MRIPIIDTETGGLDPQEHSLLSFAVSFWPPSTPGPTLDVRVRENPYRVTPGALKVNKIDLIEHDAVAVEPATAWAQLIAFLSGQKDLLKVAGRYVVGYHNAPFDIAYMQRLHRLAGETAPWEDFFARRVVDTMSFGTILVLASVLSAKHPLSLAALCKEFDVTHDAAHTALGDSVATAVLLDAMLKKVKS